jgi:ferredoxin
MPKITLKENEKQFEVKDQAIIYDALFDLGEELPHGCLAGSCGACRIEVVSGAENLQPAGLIENNTLDCLKDEFRQKHGEEFLEGKTIRLACRAKILGDIEIKSLK